MTISNFISIIVFILQMIIFSAVYGQQSKSKLILFIQDGRTDSIIHRNDSVRLMRSPFSIQFTGQQYDENSNHFYAAQIAVLNNPSDTIGLIAGRSVNEFAFFEPGSGMAPGENGFYDQFFITNTGHHYLYYHNETDKRVTLIEKNIDALVLRWDILGTYNGDKEIPLSDLPDTELFFVVLTDNNLNGIIDADELKIICTKFHS